MKYVFFVSLLLCPYFAHAQSLNGNWKSAMDQKLNTFGECARTAESPALCFRFSGESVKEIYNTNDFYDSEKQRYMMINEIYQHLEGNENWELLGKGYDQAALQKGQEHANAGRAVVAIKKEENDNYGHMAIIVPGELDTSGSWGLRVPKAASFFTHQPDKSFVNKKLSYAFTPRDQGHILIYAKK